MNHSRAIRTCCEAREKQTRWQSKGWKVCREKCIGACAGAGLGWVSVAETGAVGGEGGGVLPPTDLQAYQHHPHTNSLRAAHNQLHASTRGTQGNVQYSIVLWDGLM